MCLLSARLHSFSYCNLQYASGNFLVLRRFIISYTAVHRHPIPHVCSLMHHVTWPAGDASGCACSWQQPRGGAVLFAGHGLQLGGRNYPVPADFRAHRSISLHFGHEAELFKLFKQELERHGLMLGHTRTLGRRWLDG